MARTLTAGETTVLQGAHHATHCRVSVEDSGGTWRVLSTLGGIDHNHSGRIRQTVDQIVSDLNLKVWRQQTGDDSLAPLMASSAYAGYVRAGGGVRVDFATVANTATPGASDWKRVFEGEIDEWGVEGDFLNVAARDSIGALIADRWVEEEMELGSEDGVALATVMQEILDRWADGLVLYVPTAPAFLVTSYRQQKMSVMNALLQLAALIGWVIEPRWDDTTSTFRLTFYEPNRAPASSDWSWAANRYSEVPSFKLSRLNVRNAGSGWYTDAATGARQQYTATDATSVAAYGRQFIEFEEGDESPIDSAAEMQAMLDAAILDLKDPVAEGQWRTFCFWPVQLGDYHDFTANGVHFDADQSFGITGFTHEWQNSGHVDTLLDTRGKPAGFTEPWIIRGGKPRNPVDVANSGGLSRIEFLYDTPVGKITAQWVRGPDVYDVAYYLKTLTPPITDPDKAWPADGDAPTDVLTIGTDSLVLDVPAAGDITFLQLETRDVTAQPLKVYKYEIRPKAISTGADLPANGDIIYGALAKSFQQYGYTGAFSNDAATTVGWTGGTLTLTDGSTYTIALGSATGLSGPTAPTYIYFDATVSTTAFQMTATWDDAFGSTKLLIATAWSGATLANHVQSIGLLSLDGNAINPLSITTGLIAALAITAGKISVASLSAITADLGTVTAGTISAAVSITTNLFKGTAAVFDNTIRIFHSGGSGAKCEVGSGGFKNFDGSGTLTTYLHANGVTQDVGDLRLQANGDDVIISANGFDCSTTNIGFYGTTPIALQTGVAVTAAGIHAALVALGLITA